MNVIEVVVDVHINVVNSVWDVVANCRHNSSVVECRILKQEVAGSNLTGLYVPLCIVNINNH